jgi:hypothetical protein
MSDLSETFTIPIYEWKTVDAGQKTIRIKGVALRGDIVSKNNRKYTRDALIKATNTWINKPVNVNHDDTKKIGTIKWMDYDEDADRLLYEAEINREPYISLLRNKSTEIRGLSIQADYLYNRCAICGKKFYTEEDWRRHMMEEEFVHDLPTEPHGIQGSAISLVLSPEIPGYEGTTYELAEFHRQAALRLLETVIKIKQEEEQYKMSRIALNKESHIGVGKSKLKEQNEEPAEPEKDEHGCVVGVEVFDAQKGKCVPITKPAGIGTQSFHEQKVLEDYKKWKENKEVEEYLKKRNLKIRK